MVVLPIYTTIWQCQQSFMAHGQNSVSLSKVVNLFFFFNYCRQFAIIYNGIEIPATLYWYRRPARKSQVSSRSNLRVLLELRDVTPKYFGAEMSRPPSALGRGKELTLIRGITHTGPPKASLKWMMVGWNACLLGVMCSSVWDEERRKRRISVCHSFSGVTMVQRKHSLFFFFVVVVKT